MRASAKAIARNPWGHFERSKEVTAPLPHTHNEALFRLLYAGPLWLAAHAVFLLWLALWLKSRRYPWAGVAIALALFINGLTEPLWPMFPYLILLYLIIGAMMWAKSVEQANRAGDSNGHSLGGDAAFAPSPTQQDLSVRTG